MKRINQTLLFLLSIFVVLWMNLIRVNAAIDPLRIEGKVDHVVRLNERIDYKSGLEIVGENADQYTLEDIIVDDQYVNLQQTGIYTITYFYVKRMSPPKDMS